MSIVHDRLSFKVLNLDPFSYAETPKGVARNLEELLPLLDGSDSAVTKMAQSLWDSTKLWANHYGTWDLGLAILIENLEGTKEELHD